MMRRSVLGSIAVTGALLALTGCGSPPQATAKRWLPVETPPAGWKRVVVGDAFSFEAPNDTATIPLQGHDSAVGGFKSARFQMTYDYGQYSHPLSDETPWTAIDGYRARLESGAGPCWVFLSGEKEWPFLGAAHVELKPKEGERLALTMNGCASDEAGLEELRRLYLSLRFNPRAG